MSKMSWKDKLWPEWEIEHEIGAGAYGRVYQIRRQDIGGTYYAAMKVISVPADAEEIETLRSANMTDRQISEHFLHFANELSREFILLERLKGNSHIVSYEDHKIIPHDDGIGWDVLIRMELLTPLTRHLNQHGCDEREAIQIGMDICNALILCERENIIHRDIKPGNIFRSNYGVYKLGDFGIARTASKSRLEQTPQGTYLYMAPEVFYGKRYDRTIDIYSLGLILYRLLNHGRAPFLPPPPAHLTHDMIESANQCRLQGSAMKNPAEASGKLAAVILKACAYVPSERYQSPQDFRLALEQCLSADRTTEGVPGYSFKARIPADYQSIDSRTPVLFQDQAPGEMEQTVPLPGVQEVITPKPRLPQRKDNSAMDRFFAEAGDL